MEEVSNILLVRIWEIGILAYQNGKGKLLWKKIWPVNCL